MRFQKFLQVFEKTVWALFLISLPVTSFPFLPTELGGKTQVRPLAIYPLLILLILVTLPRLFKKRLPITFLPLFAFIIAALISSVFSLILDIESARGVTMVARVLRNLITLGIGVSIYFTVTLYQRTWDDLKWSLRWLYLGFGLVLLWGSVQAVYVIRYDETYFNLVNKIQLLISTQNLFPTRISGLTYEPKWFAEQITFLLMPWLLASVITNRTVFPWRYRLLTIESVILAWSAVILVFTYSRSGLFILILLTFVSVFLFRTFRKPHRSTAPLNRKQRLRRVIEAALVTVVIIGVVAVAGSRNPYFSRLWRYWGDDKARNKTYLQYIAFGQRFAYAETAFRIFETSPIFGVGPGNYAFYFNANLPNRPLQTSPEIIRQVTPTERGNQLITPKNLYARLLAETGLVGTFTFTTFVIAVTGCVLYLFFAPKSLSRFYGLAGILAMVAFATIVFSTDSFAIPNMWVVFGLATAAAHLSDPSIAARSERLQPAEPMAAVQATNNP